MKKSIIAIIMLLVLSLIISPSVSAITIDPDKLPVNSWAEFKNGFMEDNYNEFPFADFGRLNEIASIKKVGSPRSVVYPYDSNDIILSTYISFENSNPSYICHLDIYLLEDGQQFEHPAVLHHKILHYADDREINTTEISEPLHEHRHDSPMPHITTCDPKDFIKLNLSDTLKYQKEGVDVYMQAYNYCYFKIDNYFFRISLPEKSSDMPNPLFKVVNGVGRCLVSEEEYLESKPYFEEKMFEYELYYVWNDKSELVRLLKEIVAGIPAAPNESSQPDESSDATSDTVSSTVPNETTEPAVSDEPNESVSENGEISIAEPESSNNTVWIVIIGIATVALVIAAAVIITKKKK